MKASRGGNVPWLTVVLIALAALRRGVRRARDVPLSPLTARWRVGADYLTRHGVETGEPVAGEMDDMAEYARPDFDPDAVHPAVRGFYERTADYDLAYRVTWHRGFRVGAALASVVTSRLGQLDLPGPREPRSGRLRSEFVALGPDADPRDGARAWIRTDESGDAVFVALYASHERDGRRYVNIAAPLPFANLSTVLHLRHAGDGVELTTRSEVGDEGLYLATPLGALSLPLSQRFEVQPSDAGVRATHEMWAFGAKFLTVEYVSRERPRG